MKKVLMSAIALIIALGVIVAVIQVIESKGQTETAEQSEKATKEIPKNKMEPKKEAAIENKNDLGIDVKSEKALLLNLENGEVLYAKNAEQKAYPASLTKMMTVLVALEQIKNIKTEVEVPASIFNYIAEQNAAVAGFNPGEVATAEDLLNAVMLPSGADASLALAIHIAGSEEGFVQLMNNKANQLDMEKTHFVNVEGLHDAKHYTTAHDLTKLMKYALKNPQFKKIFTTKQYSTTATNAHPQGMTFNSTLFKKLDLTKKRGYELLGGKTGYTTESGLSLATLAEKNGINYIAVTLNAPGTNHSTQDNILDTLALYKAIPNK